MLQMALNIADLDAEPAVDLEAALTPNTITATQTPAQAENIDNDGTIERLRRDYVIYCERIINSRTFYERKVNR